jgi:uncharacterized protein YbjT (DUF2867 family)
VIAGGSGVVGTRLVARLLADPAVARVTAIGRRPLALQHEKLVCATADLLDEASIGRVCPDVVDVAFCALGTTIRRAGSQEAFRAVDHHAVVAFARAVKRKGARRFLLVSSLGAKATANSFYLRVKGEAEEDVAVMHFPSFVAARPSLLDDEGRRAEVRPGERVGLAFMRVAGAVIGRESRWAAIRADVVAAALVRLAKEPSLPARRVVLSDELHRLARG